MSIKRACRAIIFPHMALMLILAPISVVLLIYSLVFLGPDSPVAIACYVLAFYTLVVWCVRTPQLIRFFSAFKAENIYARRWLEDVNLRVKVSLYGALFINTAYALLQLGMGFWHRSFWFFSLSGYYISLAVMRFFLLSHTRKYVAGEELLREYRRYRACGAALLIMNLAISVMIFFMVYWGRTFRHHEITTIALAAYTFGSLTMAIVNVARYRKYQSPVYSAAKAISLAAASVSMLTLETTMLTTFGDGTMGDVGRRIMLGATGAAVSAFIIAMAVYMIRRSGKKITELKAKEAFHG